MELITKQMNAFMQAYIDCLNSMYNGAIFENTSKFGIITRHDNGITSRYVGITHDNKVYIRSDGTIFYKRPDLFMQEIPINTSNLFVFDEDTNLVIFEEQVLRAIPELQIYQRVPIIDLINLCYRDVDEILRLNHNTYATYSFDDLYNIFLDFGFDGTEKPEYIYDIQYDSMAYNLSFYPTKSIVGEYTTRVRGLFELPVGYHRCIEPLAGTYH